MTDPAAPPPVLEVVPQDIHPPLHVALASLVGTPVAGAWLLGRNEVVLGAPMRRIPLLVLGLLGSVAVYVMWQRLPEATAPWSVAPAYALPMWVLALVLQNARTSAALGKGAPLGSPVFAALVGAAGLAFVAGGFHLVSNIITPVNGGRVNIRAQQWVFHEENATAADASQLGETLAVTPFPGDRKPFFAGDHPVDVKLIRRDGLVILAFVLTPGAWDRPVTADGYATFGSVLKAQLYPSERVEVHLCDDTWRPRRKLPLP